jgi:hypothetical protein
VLDDLPPILRFPFLLGATADPEPVAAVGDAIVGMIRGTLPTPPQDAFWLIGHPEGTTIVPMMARASAG